MQRQKTTGRKWLVTSAVMGLTTGLMGAVVQAQPDGNNAPKGDNPPARPAPRGGGGNRPDFRNMTPEQREQFFQQQRERILRRTLNDGGFAEKALQDDVVAYAQDQDKASRLLQEQLRKLVEAMQDKATTDAQLTALLADFRADVAAEKDRREAARKVLDEKIGYTTKPRLDALLTMVGLTGDEMSVVGGMGGGMGMGGFGGQGGRGQGGRGGGQGGGNGGQGGAAPAAPAAPAVGA